MEQSDNSGRFIEESGFPSIDLGEQSVSMNNAANEFDKQSMQERNEIMKVVEPSFDTQNR